jgi:hypothetical protein
MGAKSNPQEQILVSGIFGWPTNNSLAGVQYRIDKDPTSLPPMLQTVWDYMPICSVPSITAADGNVYKAYGGLRLKKFIDAFGAQGQTNSICNSDFSGAMVNFGNGIASMMQTRPICVEPALVDSNASTAGAQPDCQATLRTPCENPGQGACLPTGYQESPILECKDVSDKPLSSQNPQPNMIPETNRPCWYLSYDLDSVTGCPNSFQGQKISVLAQTGETAAPGTMFGLSCLICQTAGDPRCAK